MACSPTELIAVAQCKYGLNPYFLEVYKTAIYCRWKRHLEDGTELTCDIQELFDDNPCFMTLPVPILKVIQTKLLCQILDLIVNPPFSSPEFDVDSGQIVIDQPTGGEVISKG